MFRKPAVIIWLLLNAANYTFASHYLVAKNGSGDFTTIQAAINAASEDDTVTILDTALYNEQVTIGSGKNGLFLRSAKPTERSKPVIFFRDTINVGPTTCDEGKDPEKVTFRKNGALRLINVCNVLVEGIVIDAGGVFVFGALSVWPDPNFGTCMWDMQSGNAALCLNGSREAVIRNCVIQNGYYGIITSDYNLEGIFAPQHDNATSGLSVPFSNVIGTGNHLIEYNRICYNSFGCYFESIYDLGSTIRYNLIYENHHPDTATAILVKNLTVDGSNQPGGAFMFKDDAVSPLAVYNNTFWHNAFFFLANEAAGATHLVFNNIFGQRHILQSDDRYSGNNWWQDIASRFKERMHNCICAMQDGTPQYPMIFRSGAGSPKNEGDFLPRLFPEESEIRWVDGRYASTESSDPDFLAPAWEDSMMQTFVLDKGWMTADIKDTDGSPADLGALSKNNRQLEDVVIIRPNTPLNVVESVLTIDFSLVIKSGTFTNPSVKLLTLVKNINPEGGFGSEAPIVKAEDVVPLDIPAAGFDRAPLSFHGEFPLAAEIGDFGFVEAIVEGSGNDGHPAYAVGFIPYRKIDYSFSVSIVSLADKQELSEITIGDTAVLWIRTLCEGKTDTAVIDTTSIRLNSGNLLNGEKTFSFPNGFSGESEMSVVFSGLPANRYDYVIVSGKRTDSTKVYGYLGYSRPIIINDRPSQGKLLPAVKVPQLNVPVMLFDLQGRMVGRSTDLHGKPGSTMGSRGGIFLYVHKNPRTGMTTVTKQLVLDKNHPRSVR